MTQIAPKRALRLLVVGNGPTGIADNGEIHVDLTGGQLLIELSQEGMEVAFAQPIESLTLALNYYGCVLPPDSVTFVPLDGRSPFSTLRTGWKLVWRLMRADFVYLFFPGKLPRLVAPICRLVRRPYGVYLRGQRFADHALDHVILRNAKFVTVTSPTMSARARSFNPEVELIRPMSDLSVADVVRRDHRQRRPGPLRLLFVGRIEAEKGVSELLEAAELIHARNIDFDLSLVGWGDLHRETAQRLQERPLPGVRLLGAIEDRAALMRMYEEADVFILPTHHEGFPRVLYEAMMKSAVIITTMVGGIPAIMQSGTNCLGIPVNDPAAIADATEMLAHDPSLRNHLAERGRETVLQMILERPSHFDILHKRLIEQAPCQLS